MSAPAGIKPAFLVLQYWQGDRDRALKMAKFFAQIERGRSPHTFVLSHRFDAAPPDDATLAQLRDKFTRVEVLAGTTRLTGHPNGCWAMWRDSVVRFRAVCENYSFGLFFEADCTPIRRDWADKVSEAVSASSPDLFVLGHHVPAIAGCEQHVNGNCGLRSDPEKLDRLLSFNVPLGAAWDVYIFPFFRSLGIANLPQIRSIYLFSAGDSHFDSLRDSGCCLHHGDKRTQLQPIAFRELLGGPGYAIRIQPPVLYTRDASTGRYIFPDPVGTPTIAAQCAESKIGYSEITTSGHPADTLRYNATIAGDGFFACRQQVIGESAGISHWPSSIVSGRIDLDTGHATIGETPSLLPPDPGYSITHYADPRLTAHEGGRPPTLGFCRATHGPLDPERSQAGFLLPGGVVYPEVGTNSGYSAKEKNWCALDGPPEGLEFIYSVHPFTLARWYPAEPDRPAMLLRDYGSSAFRAWTRAGFGEPRGGTPPIFIPEFRLWVAMFHSHSFDAARQRRYHCGWYAFSYVSGRASAVLRAASAVPVLTSSHADGFSWEPGRRYWEPSAIFPAGMVRRGLEVFVSAGINDSFSCLLRFQLGAIQQNLLPAR